MPWVAPALAIAGAASSAASGIAGLASGSSEEEARAQQAKDIANSPVASPEERSIALDYLRSVGQLSPEMEEAINLADTELKGIKVDPRYKDLQNQALRSLEKRSREGLTAEDQAIINDINRKADVANRGRQQAVLENMAARGQLGSGAELAARLQASQDAADQANQQGSDLAGLMAARRLEAQNSLGNMASKLRSEEFGEQKDVASAQDLINKFNSGNQQSVQQRNVESRNQAQRLNLANEQDIANANVGLKNQQQMYNKRALQDYYNDIYQRRASAAKANVEAGESADRNRASKLEGVTRLGGAFSAGAGLADKYLSNKEEENKRLAQEKLIDDAFNNRYKG
jgi:hypothetical protein